MGMAVELSDDLASDLKRKAWAHGKDPAQFIIEQLKRAPDVPAHLDPSRTLIAEHLRTHAREKHGFPSDNPRPLTDDDWALVEAAFAPEADSIK